MLKPTLFVVSLIAGNSISILLVDLVKNLEVILYSLLRSYISYPIYQQLVLLALILYINENVHNAIKLCPKNSVRKMCVIIGMLIKSQEATFL